MDLAVTNAVGASTFSVLLGKGDGTFAAKTDYPTGTQPKDIVAADFNGDGELDVAVAGSANAIAISLGAGDGSFGAPTSFATGSAPQSVVAADLDGDGTADLATANAGAGSFSLSVLMGTGDGTFAAKTDYAVPTASVYFAACDLNDDGGLDLVVAVAGAGSNLGVFLNQL